MKSDDIMLLYQKGWPLRCCGALIAYCTPVDGLDDTATYLAVKTTIRISYSKRIVDFGNRTLHSSLLDGCTGYINVVCNDQHDCMLRNDLLRIRLSCLNRTCH